MPLNACTNSATHHLHVYHSGQLAPLSIPGNNAQQNLGCKHCKRGARNGPADATRDQRESKQCTELGRITQYLERNSKPPGRRAAVLAAKKLAGSGTCSITCSRESISLKRRSDRQPRIPRSLPRCPLTNTWKTHIESERRTVHDATHTPATSPRCLAVPHHPAAALPLLWYCTCMKCGQQWQYRATISAPPPRSHLSSPHPHLASALTQTMTVSVP